MFSAYTLQFANFPKGGSQESYIIVLPINIACFPGYIYRLQYGFKVIESTGGPEGHQLPIDSCAKSSCQKCSMKKAALKNFAIFIGKHLR